MSVAKVLKIELASEPAKGSCNELNLQISDDQITQLAAIADDVTSKLEQLQVKSKNFEQEIRQLTSDMSLLESHSHTFSSKLIIREEVTKLLDSQISHLALPAKLVNQILDGEINSDFYKAAIHISELNSGLNKSGQSQIEADASKLYKALISTAIDRYKHYFVLLLRNLRRPGRDAQSIQHLMIECEEMNLFMHTTSPVLFESLCTAYSNTMKWYYQMLFGKYGRWMSRQPVSTADHATLLGQQALTFGIGNVKDIESFSIGARPSCLSADFEALFMTAVPPAGSPYYPLELLVASLITPLVNSLEMEKQVCGSLQLQVVPESLFTATFEFYDQVIKKWISQCKNDLFGLLITQLILSKLDADFTKQLTMLCTENAQRVLSTQAKSIESAALKASVKSSANYKHNAASLGPHLLTQLVSSYLSGIFQLPNLNLKPLESGIRDIVESYELFISKLASGDEKVMHSNYYMMSALLADIDGEIAKDLAKHFEMLVGVFSK